jgi:hypothetical protein
VLLNEKQAAIELNMPVATLQKKRVSHVGTPPYRKMGPGPKARVRYDSDDLRAWVDGLYTGPTVIVAGDSQVRNLTPGTRKK